MKQETARDERLELMAGLTLTGIMTIFLMAAISTIAEGGTVVISNGTITASGNITSSSYLEGYSPWPFYDFPSNCSGTEYVYGIGTALASATPAGANDAHTHSCENITGGTDGDYCTDADSGGASEGMNGTGPYLFNTTGNISFNSTYANAIS